MIGLRPIPTGKGPETKKKRRAIATATATPRRPRDPGQLRGRVEKHHGETRPAIPDDGFARGRAKQRGDRDFPNISVMVIRKVYLRPIKSPSRPKIRAPNGRTAKPAAKASSAKIKPTACGTLEKKYFARNTPSVP